MTKPTFILINTSGSLSDEAMLQMKEALEDIPAPPLCDEEVWLQTFNAVAGCSTSTKEVALSWADYCLEQFKQRFRKG